MEECRSFPNLLLTFADDSGLWPTADSLREAILEKGLNPNDYDLGVHLSSVVDSDAPPEKEANLAVNKILAKQNVGKRI